MCDEDGDVEPRLAALQRILSTLSQSLDELDGLGASVAAVRLAAACDALREDLASGENPPAQDR